MALLSEKGVGMTIRSYLTSDLEQITELFYETVHCVNIRDYSEEQVKVWAPGHPDCDELNRSFLEHNTVVAEEKGKIVGFGDMDKTNYLDRLYVHKAYQGRGIATAICDKLEKEAGCQTIQVHASITARPFFEKRGYCLVKEQQVERKGVFLTNFVMEKHHQ